MVVLGKEVSEIEGFVGLFPGEAVSGDPQIAEVSGSKEG